MEDGPAVLSRRKLDADEYYRMVEVGILGEQDRIELIDGEIIEMAPVGNEHIAIVDRLNEALVLAFASRAIIRVQSPIRLDRLNEPQPDFTVLRRRADFYGSAMAGPADVLLIVEVAHSSLRYDRTVKGPLYARAGIAEFWIVDVVARRVEVHRNPDGPHYGSVVTHQFGETLAPLAAPDVTLRMDQVFG